MSAAPSKYHGMPSWWQLLPYRVIIGVARRPLWCMLWLVVGILFGVIATYVATAYAATVTIPEPEHVVRIADDRYRLILSMGPDDPITGEHEITGILSNKHRTFIGGGHLCALCEMPNRVDLRDKFWMDHRLLWQTPDPLLSLQAALLCGTMTPTIRKTYPLRAYVTELGGTTTFQTEVRIGCV